MTTTHRRCVWLLLVSAVGPLTAIAQGPASLAAIAARGDAAWEASRHDDALAAYDSVVRADSSSSSRAVYRLGTLKSWRNQLRDATALHRLYVRLEPRDLEGMVGLGRVYAYASRFPESVAAYDAVLAKEADYRDAAFGRATALAWWGKLDMSIAAYDAWLRTHPSDVEAHLGRARVLAWGGRFDESLAVYARVAASGGAEAEKGIARVTGWGGDVAESERLWRAVTDKYPADAEAWVGLGQVLRWLGRPSAARTALERALAAKPDYDDARSQLRWVRAELEWSGAPAVVLSTDSEHNDATVVTAAFDGPAGADSRLSVRAVYRDNAAPGGSGTSAMVRVGAQWQPDGGRTTLRADAGITSVSATSGTPVRRSFSPFVGGVRVRSQLSTRVSAGAGASRDAFDDVISTMREQLVIASYDADVALALPARVVLSAFLSASQASGDTIASNSRTTAGGTARWTVRRGFTLALNARTASWAHPAYGAYFAPQRFTVAELAARWERPVDLGFVVAAEFAAGRQSVRFEQDPATARLAPRGSAMIGWRPAPGRELMLSWLFANVASAGTVSQSDYRYNAITITARLTR